MIGAYNYDNTIFDGLKIPDKIITKGFEDLFQEMPTLDKKVLINNLLIELGELSLKHTNIEFLKFEITTWSEKNYYNWCQLYETTFYKYNPLWNYLMNRKEDTKDDLLNAKNGNRGTKRTDTITDNLTESIGRDGESDTTDTNKVAGFDSNDPTIHDTRDSHNEWKDNSKKINTGTKLHEIDETSNDSQTGSENRTINNTFTAMGSLGTSNLSSAIDAQRRIILNMYDVIIDAFKQRFCLMIY